MEEIKKCLYDSYKMMYEDTVKQVKFCLHCAKLRREVGRMGWAAGWLKDANDAYKRAQGYKHSMKEYAS